MTYYDEIKTEIERALEGGDLDEAAYLLKRELSMPYIPEDAEQEFLKLKQRLNYARADRNEPKEASMDHLLHQLKGKPASQLSAVNALADRNLRTVSGEIRDWLSKDPQMEAASMMIELLAEQEIAEEFTVTKNGVEYTFYGDAITPVVRSEGFLMALGLISRWLAKEPSVLELVKTVLISKCYLALPLSYEAAEAKSLALECVREVLRAMDMENLLEQIETQAEDEEILRTMA